MRPSMFYDVRSELILFRNALWYRVEPDRADTNKRWIIVEAEKVVHFCIKVCFNSANFEDEFWVRYFMGSPKVCLEPHMSWN